MSNSIKPPPGFVRLDARIALMYPRILALLHKLVRPDEPHQHVDSLKCLLCEGKRLLAEIDGVIP